MPRRMTMRAPIAAVLSVSLAATLSAAGQTPPDSHPTGAEARAAFERIKSLAGSWEGRSTKGWQETLRYQVIAGGSAVLETSFEAHPGEEMATVFHMDGDRLVLTHYCVAKNQPRLEATSISDEGRTIAFTFKDGGNIPTRDKGHMDSAVFTFDGPDRVTSRWSWYQDGREKWFEDIVSTRMPEKGN
jgi:hypothetical protein